MIRVPIEIDIRLSPFSSESSSSSQSVLSAERTAWPDHGASPLLRRRGGRPGPWSGAPNVPADAAGLRSDPEQRRLAQESYDYWRSQGLSPNAALAAVGNERGENVLGSRAVGDQGTAFGSFQWHPDRVEAIKAATGIDVRTADHIDQLRAARWEAENGPGGGHIWNALKNPNISRREAVWEWVHGFERSGDQEGDYARRLGYANAFGGVLNEGAGPAVPETQHHPWAGSEHGTHRNWNETVGDIDPGLLAQVQAANPQLTPRQCVELVQSTMGVGNVHDWRRGPSAKDSPENAALATFGRHGDSETYAYGGSGTPGIGRDHALKMVKKYPDGSFDAISQDIGHPPHLVHIPWTGAGGEGDASSYFAIFNKAGQPAGANSEIFRQQYLNAAAKAGSQSSQPTENQKQNGI